MSETEYQVLAAIPSEQVVPQQGVTQNTLVKKRTGGPQRVHEIVRLFRAWNWIRGGPWGYLRTESGSEALADERAYRERLARNAV